MAVLHSIAAIRNKGKKEKEKVNAVREDKNREKKEL